MIRVLFFGRVADAIGRSLDVEPPPEVRTVGELRRWLGAQDGRGILLKPGVRASVDREVAPDETPLRDGAEVAFFSLFSGG
jgi:molybdopterin synthase sulfur carrier subunit